MSSSYKASFLGKKIVFMIIIFVTLIPARLGILIISLIQLGFSLFKGKPHEALVALSTFISQYITSSLHYVLFLSDTLPYPLNKISS